MFSMSISSVSFIEAAAWLSRVTSIDALFEWSLTVWYNVLQSLIRTLRNYNTIISIISGYLCEFKCLTFSSKFSIFRSIYYLNLFLLNDAFFNKTKLTIKKWRISDFNTGAYFCFSFNDYKKIKFYYLRIYKLLNDLFI